MRCDAAEGVRGRRDDAVGTGRGGYAEEGAEEEGEGRFKIMGGKGTDSTKAFKP